MKNLIGVFGILVVFLGVASLAKCQTMIDPVQLRDAWQQVNWQACADNGTHDNWGTRVQINQLRKTYEQSSGELASTLLRPVVELPVSMAGPASPPPHPPMLGARATEKLMLAAGTGGVESENCWPANISRDFWLVNETKCTRCHGNDLTPGDVSRVGFLDMRTRESMIRGGKSGAALKPGNVELSPLGSLIYWFVVPRTAEQNSNDPGEVPVSMPPYAPMENNEVEVVRRYVVIGAPYIK